MLSSLAHAELDPLAEPHMRAHTEICTLRHELNDGVMRRVSLWAGVLPELSLLEAALIR